MTAGMDIKETLGITAGKNLRKRYVYALVALVLILCVAGLLVSRRSALAAKSAVHYRTESARTGDLTVTVTATGQLKPTRTVEVGSQVSGIVDEVNVKYNDIVKRDEVLARINTEKLDAQLQQDEAALDSALAKVEDTKVTVAQSGAQYNRDLDARQRSKTYQIVSQQDLDTDKATYDHAVVSVKTAEAAVIQARDNLKIDQTNLNFAVIAIGAFDNDVMIQFLVEAVVLASLGGLIGIMLGFAASYAGCLLMKFAYSPNLTIAAIAFVFSGMVGVVFGFFPAQKAARLDPIEALRHE